MKSASHFHSTLKNWEQDRAKLNAQAALLINLVKHSPGTVQDSPSIETDSSHKADLTLKSLRSRRKHKAWGVSPRFLISGFKSPCNGRQLVCALSTDSSSSTWGSRPLKAFLCLRLLRRLKKPASRFANTSRRKRKWRWCPLRLDV